MPTRISIPGLKRLLKERTEHGRVCVPILGSGVNIQAAIVDGLPNCDDWEGLLRTVGQKIKLSPRAFDNLPRSNLAKWETMLRRCAAVEGIKSSEAEAALQKLVCRELRSQESATRDCSLYGEFVAARFQDLISLNFDRRIALHSQPAKFQPAPQGKGVAAAEESVYRHDLIRHDDGRGSRIWYPHGDTKKVATLKFGVRKYGYYIASLEEHFKRLMTKWRETSDGPDSNWLSARQLDEKFRCGEARPAWLTWPMIFLVAPLVFIGCSLAFDEWPLWWLLHQRARIHAAFPREQNPPTLCLCAGDVPDNLQGQPCEIEVLQFDSFPELWSTFRGALA